MQIGYADFIRVFNIHDPLDWVPGLEVRKDGIWIVPAHDDDDCKPEERAILAEHPEKDLSKPALPFPCDFHRLEQFLSWLGMPLEVFIGDKWRPGQDLLKEYGIQGFQLFDLLKEGVQARTITGLQVVNEDELERRGKESLAELERIEFYREGAAASGIVIAGRGPVEPRAPTKRTDDDEIKKAAQAAFEKQPKDVLVIPDGCEAISYSLSYDDNKKRMAAILRAVGFLFKSVDVIKHMWNHNIKFVESSHGLEGYCDRETLEKIPDDEPESDACIVPRENLSKMGQKGGKASKIKQPILDAIIQYLSGKPDRLQQSANTICKGFTSAHKEPKAIEVNGVDYDVYFEKGKIYSKAFLKNKTIETSINLNTFKNGYISEAKKRLNLKSCKKH
jgi:hypothetical protein